MDAIRISDEYNFMTIRGGLAKEGDTDNETQE
jgi:hypothetical protein